MPGWAWWGLISGGLCVLSWLYGRLSRPHAPAGNGSWEPWWAVYFSPNGGAVRAILECIRSAQQTILVQAHLFYSMRLAGALVRAHQRGVQVHIILDANAQTHNPPVKAVALLVGAGLAVSLDNEHEWAHDKVMILDGTIVITGSYNWTLAAEHNNGENLLVIRDPRLAAVYTENWQYHADHSFRYRGQVLWWAYIRGLWSVLLRRRRPRLSREIGEVYRRENINRPAREQRRFEPGFPEQWRHGTRLVRHFRVATNPCWRSSGPYHVPASVPLSMISKIAVKIAPGTMIR